MAEAEDREEAKVAARGTGVFVFVDGSRYGGWPPVGIARRPALTVAAQRASGRRWTV